MKRSHSRLATGIMGVALSVCVLGGGRATAAILEKRGLHVAGGATPYIWSPEALTK